MSESNSLLQRFFDASLIPADTGDDRLGHYQAAAADLAKRFAETPRDAVSASRVAIDPRCPAIDPWFTVVQDAVKVYWKTFLTNHYDAPRQISRAILLEALSIAVAKDENLSAAVWNAASSLLPHLGTGPEQTIPREFISKLGGECEAYSSELWQLGRSSGDKSPVFTIKLPVSKLSKVSESELTKGLSDAAGPHNAQGKNFGNPNPHWANNPTAWVGEFAQRAAKTIASEVNDALSALAPSLKGINEQLEPVLNQYTAALGEWVINSTQNNGQFTSLLWWKQALYSSSLKRSYRGLSATDISIATSFDISEVSGSPLPVSVEFFFREVTRATTANGWLLMVRSELFRSSRDLLHRPLKDFEPKTPPTSALPEWMPEAALVEMLQMLLFIRRSGRESQIVKPRLVVAITCWDEARNESAPTKPHDELRKLTPMLTNFVEGLWDSTSLVVVGLSALGKTLSPNVDDETFADRGPHRQGFVILPDGSRTDDLTWPLTKLLC